MEAVWRIEVRDFPAFIVVDDKGNDFYADVTASKASLLTIGSPPSRPERWPVTDPRFRTEHDSMGEVAVPASPAEGELPRRRASPGRCWWRVTRSYRVPPKISYGLECLNPLRRMRGHAPGWKPKR